MTSKSHEVVLPRAEMCDQDSTTTKQTVATYIVRRQLGEALTARTRFAVVRKDAGNMVTTLQRSCSCVLDPKRKVSHQRGAVSAIRPVEAGLLLWRRRSAAKRLGLGAPRIAHLIVWSWLAARRAPSYACHAALGELRRPTPMISWSPSFAHGEPNCFKLSSNSSSADSRHDKALM